MKEKRSGPTTSLFLNFSSTRIAGKFINIVNMIKTKIKIGFTEIGAVAVPTTNQ